MDYQEELKKVEAFKESGDFWSPEAGQYKVKSLSEFEPTDPYEEEGKEPKPRVKLRIEVNGKEFDWTVGVGKTQASTYGQLLKLATVKNNTLKDVEFTVVVVSDGNRNSYTIVM